MTAQDYLAIADVIRAQHFYIRSEAIRALADLFVSTNPDFDRKAWYSYIDGKTDASGVPVAKVRHYLAGNP